MDRKAAIEALLYAAGDLTRHKPLSPVNRNLRGEALALHVLCAAPDGLTPGALGTQLEVSAPRVAAILDALEAKGMVRRCPDPKDRRRILTFPTEAGRLQDKANKQSVLSHTEQFLSVLTDDEIEALSVILGKLKGAHCSKEDTQC